jgi:hypothetical protein
MTVTGSAELSVVMTTDESESGTAQAGATSVSGIGGIRVGRLVLEPLLSDTGPGECCAWTGYQAGGFTGRCLRVSLEGHGERQTGN